MILLLEKAFREILYSTCNVTALRMQAIRLKQIRNIYMLLSNANLLLVKKKEKILPTCNRYVTNRASHDT